MSNINQDLQASYQIISLLERSKANSESIIDRLPDVFVIIEQKGSILKGNEEAAKLLKLGVEDLLGMNISRLFLEETWRLFQIYVKQASEIKPGDKPIEFELPIDGVFGIDRICYWTISPLEGVFRNESKLYCLIGRDITLLRRYQQQLAEIFASIPLGIFTVDKDGTITDPFSAYTRWLLGVEEVARIGIRKLIYEPAMPFLDAGQREGWNNLLNYANHSLREFDLLSETYPTQFYYPLPGSAPAADGQSLGDSVQQGRYLGIKCQSIAHSNKISGLLIILEDRTAIVEAEKSDEKQRLLQDMNLERALQIKKADPDILAVTLNDLKSLLPQLGDAVFSKDFDNFMNILHSVKGNARLAGFTVLVKLTHALESRIREDVKINKFDWKVVLSNLEEIRAEWKEILSLARVMTDMEKDSGPLEEGGAGTTQVSIFKLFKQFEGALKGPVLDDKAKSIADQLRSRIKAISFKSITTLEDVLRRSTQTTAQTLGKKFRFVFDWDEGLFIDESYFPNIRTCLMHLINNSLDHGLESPENRVEAQKPLQGLIRLNAYQAGERLVFTVEDDGAGLNADKIRGSALKKGLITELTASRLSPEEVYKLIFLSGFSSAQTVTEISGRGVGLSAVKEIVSEHNGEIEVGQGKYGGACFQFFFKIDSAELG